MGVLRQAHFPPGRRERFASPAQLLVPLLLGFALSATTVFALASIAGSAVRARLDPPWTPVMLIVLAGCIAADLRFPRLRCTLMRRQTPQTVVGVLPAPLGCFVWGLDTGSVVSTYRASAASWAALLLVLAGWAPWWAGIAYAAGFGIPLALLVVSYSGGAASRRRTGFSAFARADTDRAVVPALLAAAPRVRLVSALLALAAAATVLVGAH